jgi:plasmid stability protein
MATLQVKGMDDDLYRALGARAARDNRSVSQEVVTIIRDFLAHPSWASERASHELMALCGSWEDTRTPDQIVRMLKKARRNRARTAGVGDVSA